MGEPPKTSDPPLPTSPDNATVRATGALETVCTLARAFALALRRAAGPETVDGLFLLFHFFQSYHRAVQFRLVELLDCGLRLSFVGHFDKGKTAGPSGDLIHDQLDRGHLPMLLKGLANDGLAGLPREVGNVNLQLDSV